MSDYATTNEQVRQIAHEIRNQLSICDIYSEIIKKHLIKSNIQNPSIDNALNCIQNAVKLIGNNLIDLKSTSNYIPHICESDKLLKESTEMSKVYIRDKEINLESNLATDSKIYVDENKFQGCIINIIKNAIEAIPQKGYVKISSKCTNKDLIIEISNNGKIIPPEIQENIFADGYTTKSTGSGIGLYLCKKNLESMNGNIEISTSTNELTVFEIKIPLYK